LKKCFNRLIFHNLQIDADLDPDPTYHFDVDPVRITAFYYYLRHTLILHINPYIHHIRIGLLQFSSSLSLSSVISVGMPGHDSNPGSCLGLNHGRRPNGDPSVLTKIIFFFSFFRKTLPGHPSCNWRHSCGPSRISLSTCHTLTKVTIYVKTYPRNVPRSMKSSGRDLRDNSISIISQCTGYESRIFRSEVYKLGKGESLC
jgi:hypothetical protein